MAHIVPSISFLRNIKGTIEKGSSVQVALIEATETEKTDFSAKVSLWWTYHTNGLASPYPFKTHYQKSFIEILDSGLEGAPIYEHLCLLENEMTLEFDRQWKLYLESLPMKLAVPLLLFFFPAYVILLFGPLLTQFLNEVS